MSEFQDMFGEWALDVDGEPLSVTVESHQGEGAWSAGLASPQVVTGCPVLTGSGLIRDSNGNEVVCIGSIYVDLEHEHADLFTLHSRVTLPDGRVGTVEQVSSPNVFGLFGFKVVTLA